MHRMDADELDQQQRALRAEVIDRIAAEPDFAEALKVDPEQALADAGLDARAHQLLTAVQPADDEVAGFAAPPLRPTAMGAIFGSSPSSLTAQIDGLHRPRPGTTGIIAQSGDGSI